MRGATTILLGLVAAVLAASASASGAAQDPLRLTPQRSDLPAKTRLTSGLSPSADTTFAAAGLQGKTADSLVRIPRRRTEALLVGGAAQPIAKLALQRADVPANTERAPFGQPDIRVMDRSALSPLGVRGLQGADYAYSVPAGGTVDAPIGAVAKTWRLEGEVFRAPSRSAAKRLFALGKAAGTGFFSDFPVRTQNLALPRYGDEQVGRVSTGSRDGIHVMVLVRAGSVVWELMVVPTPRQFEATKAQVVAVLQTYAAKQRGRVGAS
jgi:hypothetical protein